MEIGKDMEGEELPGGDAQEGTTEEGELQGQRGERTTAVKIGGVLRSLPHIRRT